MVLHRVTNAVDLLRFYREFSSALPDEAEAWASLLTSPEGEPVLAYLLAYNGDLAEGERVLEPARKYGSPMADLIGPMPYVQRQAQIDAALASYGVHRYWKSGFVSEVS